MVPVMSLWIPILGSAVVVFAASSLLHMVLPWHRNDLRRVPKEDEVMNALRRFSPPPGDYFVPHASSPEASRSPEFVEEMKKGPVIVMTVLPSGPPEMGTSLTLWFLYSVVVGIFPAYPHSFPSGHAARAALLAILAIGLGPAWLGLILALWAPLVMLARVAMGVHFLADVLEGALLGVLVGLAVLIFVPLPVMPV